MVIFLLTVFAYVFWANNQILRLKVVPRTHLYFHKFFLSVVDKFYYWVGQPILKQFSYDRLLLQIIVVLSFKQVLNITLFDETLFYIFKISIECVLLYMLSFHFLILVSGHDPKDF